MNEDQFSAMLTLIVPQIVGLISKNGNKQETEAVSDFYRSKLYDELSHEDSKMWHYSPMMLYSMYCDEIRTGSYEYPEES